MGVFFFSLSYFFGRSLLDDLDRFFPREAEKGRRRLRGAPTDFIYARNTREETDNDNPKDKYHAQALGELIMAYGRAALGPHAARIGYNAELEYKIIL